jgi:hypothetical protein
MRSGGFVIGWSAPDTDTLAENTRVRLRHTQ